MWNFATNVAGIECCAAKGSDRAVHKIINVLYAYKDSLDDLKEAEEIMKSEGTPADVDLIQVAKTLRERVGKLLIDVLEVHKLQECLGVAQSAPRAPIFSSSLCEYPQVSFAGVGGEAKRRRALLSKTGAKTKISVGGSKDGVVVHADVKGKGRASSEGEVVCGCGERVAEEEEMNPSIWSNLPVNLVELVLALVVPQIEDSSQCRSTRLPDTLPPSEVSKLMYTNSGIALLALGSNAVHKLWKWQRSERNPSGKATASFPPQLWQPASGVSMRNDISDTCSEGAMPCIALSKNDSYVMSGSGGKVSLFNMMTFKVMTTFMPSPPAATVIAFHPQDNNIIALGMEDSSIQIYNVRVDEVKTKLKGHHRRITGLAFSNTLDVLVSSGADAQISVWCTSAWRRRNVAVVQPEGRLPYMDETLVQFHKDQVKLLVVRESQLAIYNADTLMRLCQWVPQRSLLPQRSSTSLLTNATYSCDSQLVFAGFLDGCVGVFDAKNLEPCCWLAPSVYIPQGVHRSTVYPLVIAAHPIEPNQFALGLSDGGVQVIEPLEEEGKWGNGPSAEKGKGTGNV